MSENQTPRRRRRDAAQPAPAPQSAPATQPQSSAASAPKRHRTTIAPTEMPKMPHLDPETGAVMPKRRRRPDDESAHSSLTRGLSLPLRILAVTLASIVLLAGMVTVTRGYLAAQEERRRLEAEAAEKAQHPLRYEEFIRKYAEMQGLDPALVSAVILCESSFDPQAESHVGARGLMQLMEDTAAWVAHKLSEDNAQYSFDLLYDPETNIRYGCWYLGYLSRRWNGDPLKIVCGYHAGQGNVDAWLKNPDYSPDGVTLAVVPMADTAAYSSRVLTAQLIYQKYYFPVATPQPPEAESVSDM